MKKTKVVTKLITLRLNAIQRRRMVRIFLKIGTDILPMLPIPLIMPIRRIPDMHSDSAALQRFLRK